MMARMEMDYKMDFWKPLRMNFFQMFKFVTEIIESLQNCCYISKFLHEIAFEHSARVLKVIFP